MSQPLSTERHYTVAEVAKMWQMSQSTVLRIFKLEAGVLMIGNVNTRKRTKIYLRIPQSVLDRVHTGRLSRSAVYPLHRPSVAESA
jgi:AraC-like DNA-binding protein